MKVLVIGSGGREHAITWKVSQSKKVKKIYCAPGNGGMAQIAELVNINAENIEGLLKFAKENKIDLTIVGPETPLVLGIVNKFTAVGLRIFGPTKEVARLEGSKVFSKKIMAELGVPTADFQIFNNTEDAIKYIEKKGAPIVIKADGLCGGKGVIVCKTIAEAKGAVEAIIKDKKFGAAGEQIVIEDCLIGEEASIIVISDGKNVVLLASSQDHKAIYDGDKGPNTGGMGAYSPAPVITDDLFKIIMKDVIYPVIKGLADKSTPYKGTLYAGLMVTKDGPKVLEFNARFGDPETQAIFPRLKDDIIELMEASIDGTLGKKKLNWNKKPCVSVVVASGGYPEKYEKGKVINGLEEAGKTKDVVVFHAGTVLIEDKKNGTKNFITNGGRVLNVTALGNNVKDAIERAYAALDKIKFDKMYYRRDIGYRAMNRKGGDGYEKESCLSNYGK